MNLPDLSEPALILTCLYYITTLTVRRDAFDMSNNSNMHRAKQAKNDEFYTNMYDIANEMQHYKQHLKDKVIYCNCDNPEWSNFWNYFHLNFAEFGLKSLIATFYDTQKAVYKKEYTGGDDLDCGKGTVIPLQGNGDFRNSECVDILKSTDIIVTNPPFSLFREYITQLMSLDKKFVIIGSMNAITYKEVFPLIKGNKVWLGYTHPHEFLQPADLGIKKFGNIDWFTNLDIDKRHEKLILYKQYTPEEYPKYDNYDAINVNKVSEIPVGYQGVMGVPITFLDKYNPDEFEIIGHEHDLQGNGSDGLSEGQFEVNGVGKYKRILIQRKV